MDTNNKVVVTSEKYKKVTIGKDDWTIHLKGIPRLTEEDPLDIFARSFGFNKVKEIENDTQS